MDSIASYNSDKIKLQDSITRVYDKIQNPKDDTRQYTAINDETRRLVERQEVIFRMVSTITVVAILVTVQRLS
jgi:hypothetical protein